MMMKVSELEQEVYESRTFYRGCDCGPCAAMEALFADWKAMREELTIIAERWPPQVHSSKAAAGTLAQRVIETLKLKP